MPCASTSSTRCCSASGLVAFATFALVTPLVDWLEAEVRFAGLSRPNLDQLLPGITDLPLVSFVIYLVVLDFADYWIHRAQHRRMWWWQLHAVHHSQRQMTFWSDSRNHLLDDLLRDALLALAGGADRRRAGAVRRADGADPRAAEPAAREPAASLRRRARAACWSAPASIACITRSATATRARRAAVNFGVLFSWWDSLFGTADWRPGFVPTGIRDQLEGRDYGRGFWAQHWRALLRIAGRN